MPDAARLRATLVMPILLGIGLVAAACTSSPSASNTSTTSTSAHQAATSSTTVPPTTSTTLSTSGPLQAGAPIAVPLTASQVAATEGPDGAVFVSAQDPTNRAPAVVWVIDGNGPAAVAEHTQLGVAALAADSNNLYVATYQDVTAYDRTSGNQSGHWSLPAINTANTSNADLVALAAAGGRVYVSITQGNAVSVYRINPSSSTRPTQLVQGLGDAVGPDGTVYYERADHHLVALGHAGSTTVGPALADAPNGLGGGVQYVDTVAGGALFVDEPAGQGLDQQWATYNTATLQPVATFAGNVGQSFVDTAGGPLALISPNVQSGCTSGGNQVGTWCVSRVDLHGTMTDPLPAPNAVELVGPQPVVVGQNTANGQVEVTRLS